MESEGHIHIRKGTVQAIFDIVANIVLIIVFVYVIRAYFVSPFQVYGPSMCDTLNFIEDYCERGYGEYLIVNKAVYQRFFGWQPSPPQRGDIVVFRPNPQKREFYIKRIIGIPGDSVKTENGKVFLKKEGEAHFAEIEEPYLNARNKGNAEALGPDKTFDVPEDHYFVMGDNRDESTDGRLCFGMHCNTPNDHFVPMDQIEGRAWIVLWPFSNVRILPSQG